MASIFTKIINREIPGHIIAEDDNYIAFLDIMPLVRGHVLIVPKVEVDYIFDLEDEVYSGRHLFAKKVALAIKKVIPSSLIRSAVIGLEVPHVHIHLVPMNTMDDLNYPRPKLKWDQEELADIAAKIKSAIH